MTRRIYSALPQALKRCIHAVALLTMLSGIAWLAIRYGSQGWTDEAIARRAEAWLLKFHGAAAMLALVALGALLSAHILPGLRKRRNRGAGIALLAGTVTLGITGWCLYYLGDETLRGWTSDFHIAVGLAAAAAFIHHIHYRKACEKRARRRAPADQRFTARS